MRPIREPGDERPDCIEGPAAFPRLDPRPMPGLLQACPATRDGARQRYRHPLWRRYEELHDE